MRLTNIEDVENIKARITGFDAAILGTIYQLEKRPVTANTYEKTPNDKTLEFYMDDRNMVEATVSDEDMDVHLALFQNSIDACKSVGIEHIVVVETPATKSSKPFAKILDTAGIKFTYIHASGSLENTKLYTFEEGVQSDINIQGFTISDGYMNKNGYSAGDWSESFQDEIKGNEKQSIAREDLAAVVVQSLMSLDWGKSRCIDVSSNGALAIEDKSSDGVYVPTKVLKSDKDWCLKSEILAAKLSTID
jgi:hypothetical protein